MRFGERVRASIVATLDGLFAPVTIQQWERGHPLTFPYSTVAGLQVSEESALQIAAALAAVRIRSELVASMPLVTYRRRKSGGKDRATDHPVYPLLHDDPNENVTTFTWRETGNAHLLLWGNWYGPIATSGGVPTRLDLWHPAQVEPIRLPDGEIVYDVAESGGTRRYARESVIHVPGLGFDGMRGFSRIAMARNALGLAQATEAFGSMLFRNGTKMSGVFEHPGKLGDPAYERLKASLDEYRGLSNSQKTLILEEGMKWNAQSIPPEDAQFLETRKFQVSEIARIFGVPPHLLADLERATFSNIEQQSLELVVYHMQPTLRKIEHELNRKLFRRGERQEFFVEFLVDGLLRGDIKSRFEAYAVAVNNGWMNANEIRDRENMNPYAGGDRFRMPANEQLVGGPN